MIRGKHNQQNVISVQQSWLNLPWSFGGVEVVTGWWLFSGDISNDIAEINITETEKI